MILKYEDFLLMLFRQNIMKYIRMHDIQSSQTYKSEKKRNQLLNGKHFGRVNTLHKKKEYSLTIITPNMSSVEK